MSGPAWETHQLLFLYGSLLLPTGDAAVDAAVASGISLGEAWIYGTLHDLGDYPGAKPAAGARSVPDSDAGADATAGTAAAAAGAAEAAIAEAPRIKGRLLGFRDPESAFAVLDRYEGFDPASPESGEFARVLAEAVLPESGRTVTAQVYFYLPSVAGRVPIPSGDYLAYRRLRQGARA